MWNAVTSIGHTRINQIHVPGSAPLNVVDVLCKYQYKDDTFTDNPICGGILRNVVL